jgi:hypothetical protein
MNATVKMVRNQNRVLSVLTPAGDAAAPPDTFAAWTFLSWRDDFFIEIFLRPIVTC